MVGCTHVRKDNMTGAADAADKSSRQPSCQLPAQLLYRHQGHTMSVYVTMKLGLAIVPSPSQLVRVE